MQGVKEGTFTKMYHIGAEQCSLVLVSVIDYLWNKHNYSPSPCHMTLKVFVLGGSRILNLGWPA